MIDTEALRKKVIGLAIQGKLTEQRPTDGDAEALYVQIKEEKARLIKEGKLKKEKPSTEITEDEMLFNIPSNWKWVHLNEIAVSSLGKTLNKSTDKGELCEYLCSINVQWGEINLETVKTARFEEDEKDKYKLQSGDLLICEGGDSGRCAIWESDEEMYYQNALHRVRFFCGISPRLYSYIIEFYKKSGIISFYTKGIGIQHLVQSSLNALWLPLPPLAEQARIVTKLQAVMEAIGIIDSLQQQYQSDLAVLKGKIIDAGIRGKLTEQLPEDGDAETLYAEIQEEKSKIIESRGGRKDKSIKAEDEEKPFAIPDNWKWIRFGEVGLFKKGPFGSALTKSMFVPKSDDAVKVYEQQHAIKKDASLGTYYISREYFESTMTGFEVKSGDIIVSCAGTIGETYVMPEEMEQGIINQALMRVTLVPSIMDEFFLFYFDSNLKSNAQNESNGMAIKNIPPFDVMKNWYFPLPPLNEQKRIVAKIEAILEQL